MGQDLVRGEVQLGEAAGGGAQAAHGGRGEHAVADDVADEEPDAGAGQGDDVVPVAAHVGLRGQVAVGDLDGVLVGQAVREQAALEGQDHGAFVGVAPGVVDGQGGSGGELLGQRAVVVPEGSPGAVEAGDAQDDTAGEQGHRDEGVDVGQQARGVLGVLGEPARGGLQIRLQHRFAAGQAAQLRRGRAEVHALAGRGEGQALADAVDDRAAQVGEGVGGFLAAQDGVGQVDGDEVGEPRDGRLGQFLGGAADVQGGADAGAGLGQQLQAPARGQGVGPDVRLPHHQQPPGRERRPGALLPHAQASDGGEGPTGLGGAPVAPGDDGLLRPGGVPAAGGDGLIRLGGSGPVGGDGLVRLDDAPARSVRDDGLTRVGCGGLSRPGGAPVPVGHGAVARLGRPPLPVGRDHRAGFGGQVPGRQREGRSCGQCGDLAGVQREGGQVRHGVHLVRQDEGRSGRGAGQHGLHDEAPHPGGARHRTAHERHPPAVGQGHVDGGPLRAGDQLGGLLHQDRPVPRVERVRRRVPRDAPAARPGGSGPRGRVRPQQGSLVRGALSQQPPLDDLGRPADGGRQPGLLEAARVAEAQDALDAPAERVPDGQRHTGVLLGALREVLGAVDADELPLGEGQADPVGAGDLLREDEPRDDLDRRQAPGHRGVPEAAQQDCSVRVGDRDVDLAAGERGLQPVQHGSGRADDAATRVEVVPVGQVGPVRRQPQGPAAPPRVQDGRPHALLDRLALEEPLAKTGGPRALSRTTRRLGFLAGPNHAPPHLRP